MQEKRMRGESAKQVAIDVLSKARRPLPAKEIAKRVIESGRCAGLKGKTPEATISAMLAVGSKPGGLFKCVEKGTYTLAAADANLADQSGAKKRTGTPRAARPGKKQPARHDVAKRPAHPDQNVTPEPEPEPEAAREPVAEPAA